MKNFSAKIILVFMALILARGAFAAGQDVTIKDGETGMTVELYAIPNEEELFFYGNQRFGYNVSVPYKYFTEVVLLPENEDGMILESKDGTGRFRVTGGYLLDEGELVESYAGALKAIGGENNASFAYLGDDYWELCWWEGETFHRRKFVIKSGEGVWCEIEIYNVSKNSEEHYDPLDDVIYNSVESLGFADE